MVKVENVETIRHYWTHGQSVEAGKLVYESLPVHHRPRWAVNILRLVLSRAGYETESISQLLRIADQESDWVDAHGAFSDVRSDVLQFDRKYVRYPRDLTEEKKLHWHILLLAELVAKVTYNAADPPDPFDEDSGWYIPNWLRGFADTTWKDQDFADAAWKALLFKDTHGNDMK
jgi:hypothetical protein